MSKTTGKVRKFGRYSASQLQKMKIDLSLSMSDEALEFCANYYRTAEKRDPLIGELRLLDTLTAKLAPSPATISIEEFKTNNRFLAETYEDLIEKRRILYPDATYPVTLSEAMTVADSYLERAGKQHGLPRRTLLLEDNRHSKRIPGKRAGFGISGSRHQLRVLHKNGLAGNPEQGDALILFVPKSGKSAVQYQRNMSQLLRAMGNTAPWKRLYTVRSGGLLPSLLLQSTTGLRIDVARLSENDDMISLIPLTEAFHGSRFAILPTEDAKPIMEKAEEYDIHAICFASVTDNDRITVTAHKEELFSLKMGFLRALLQATPVCARLANEKEDDRARVRHTPTSAASCAYLLTQSEHPDTETAQISDALCATAFCAPEESFCKNAFYTALSPIVTLAASGKAYTEQRLAVGFTLPESIHDSEETVGDCLAAILGIYRLQAELGIPAAASSLLTDPEQVHPQFTVYSAVSEGKSISASLTKAGNTVYCLRPAIAKNGFPHFDLLRDFLRDLTARARSSSIISARVLCRESITDGLMKMTHGDLYCRIEDTAIVSHGAIPIGVLIETEKPIAGLTPIGFVEQRDEEITKAEPMSVEPIHSAIWSEQTEFVIYCEPSDIDAQTLEDILVHRGASVHLIEALADNAGALSRALLTSHVLIQCKNVNLPKNEHVDFALDTMLRAGGAWWSIGATTDDRAIPFPKGIPEDALETVMKK